jgi:hypothetical protein
MIGNQFSQNGSNLMYVTPDFRVAVSDVQWRKLKVSDDTHFDNKPMWK